MARRRLKYFIFCLIPLLVGLLSQSHYSEKFFYIDSHRISTKNKSNFEDASTIIANTSIATPSPEFKLTSNTFNLSDDLNETVSSSNLQEYSSRLSAKSFKRHTRSSKSGRHKKQHPETGLYYFLERFGQTGETLYFCWKAFTDVSKEVDKLFSVFSEEEKFWIMNHYEEVFNRLSPNIDTIEKSSLQLLELATRIDLMQLTKSTKKLALIANQIYLIRDILLQMDLKDDFFWEEEGFKFVVSKHSNTKYQQDADFYIGLGKHNSSLTSAILNNPKVTLLHCEIQSEGYTTSAKSLIGVGFNPESFSDLFSIEGTGLFGFFALVDHRGYSEYKLNFFGKNLTTYSFQEAFSFSTHTKAMEQFLATEKPELNRSWGAFFLAQSITADSLKLLTQALKSDSSLMRYLTVTGLRGKQLPNILDMVIPLFSDNNIKVRLAAGLTAVSLKDKSGITLIINSLDEDNLFILNDLTSYLGVNFGTDIQAWKSWWASEKGSFSFKQ